MIPFWQNSWKFRFNNKFQLGINLEYPIENSTPKSFVVGFEHFSLELVQRNFGMEFVIGDSIIKSLVTNFVKGIGIIMIGCYFIQLVETMLEGQKGFIHTHKMIFAIGTGFKHLYFNIKGGIVHSFIPFFYNIVMLLKFVLNLS